jgi:hypothetical protein
MTGTGGRLPHDLNLETDLLMTLERIGTIALVSATVLVGVSILLDGTLSRLFNGVAGLTWFAAAGLLGLAAWRSSRSWTLWLSVLGLTSLVAFVVTPSAMVPAMIGFGIAGSVIAMLAPNRPVLWAKLVVGLYLPFHIGTAIAKAIYRSATGGEVALRTDPPPTAAMVPLVMLASAVAGSLAVQAWTRRRVRNVAGGQSRRALPNG